MASEPETVLDDADDQSHDLWSWVNEGETAGTPTPITDRVTAILVARNGEAWLPAALAGLHSQTRRPDRIVAVDNGSTDDTRALLRAARDEGVIDDVYAGEAGWGFGRAVRAALETEEADDEPAPGWLWLLHDDAVAEPDALEQLLVHLAEDPTIDFLGPKLLMPSRRYAGRQISELGVSIAESGARELALSPGEIDQGQHEARATLGVSTCGMLARASAFTALGGFDDAVPLFRDGVELGWRANLAGHRVVTSPRAVLTHRQVGRAGARPDVDGSPTVRDRAYGMLVVAAHHRGLMGPLVAVGLMLGALLRSLAYLVGKAPGRAADELRALRLFVRSTGQAHALRRRVGAIEVAKVDADRIRRLRPRWYAGALAAWGTLLSWVGDTWEDAFGRSESSTSLDDLTGDDFSGGRPATRRRSWAVSSLMTLAAVAVLALVAGRRVLGLGHLASLRLLPAQDSLAAMLRDYTAPIPGVPGEMGPPWLGLLGLGSVITFGQPELLVSLLLLGCVPLASVAGFFFLRRVATDRRTRLLGALAYGLLPALLGAVSRGDLGLAVAAIVLPLLGLAVLAWRRRGTSGFESWRGPFAVALGLTVLASFAPLVWLMAALVGIVAVGATRGRHATRVLVALAIPFVLLAPWLPTLWKHPGRLLTGFDPMMAGSAQVPTLDLLIGRTPGAGLPPLWLSIAFFVVLWLLGLLGLALRPHAARAWALLAVAGLTTAVVVTRVIVLVPAADDPVRPTVGTWLLIAFGALITLVAQGWDHVQAQLANRAFGLVQWLSVAALALATLATAAGLAWWVVAGESAPLHRTTLSDVPAFARQTQGSGQGLRTLTVDLSEARPAWSLTEGDGNRLGDTERGEAFGGHVDAIERARRVVADVASGRIDQDVTAELVELGVGHLWLNHAPDDVLAAVGSLPGLAQVTADEHARIWRVVPLRSRAMLVTPDETVAVPENGAIIPAGPANRRLVLAEPADPRWHLTIDGQRVEPITVEGDTRQWFAVGERAGTLRWELDGAGAWLAWLQLAGLVVVGVLAAPTIRRTERRDPELFARRAARLETDEVTA